MTVSATVTKPAVSGAAADAAVGTQPGCPPRFRFIDVFAGIGGMRAGLEMADGQCAFTIENDPHACQTYSANWGFVEPLDVRSVNPHELPEYDVLAAGFPCQPFSLAGVVKKESLKRESYRRANEVVDEASVKRSHGFHDPVSGNLFFQIIRLIGGPWNLPQEELEREAADPDSCEPELEREGDELLRTTTTLHLMPPVLLLENVPNLKSHDEGRTFRIIRRRLIRSGYRVEYRVISAAHWVAQGRRRIFIVGLRRDRFDDPFVFPDVPEGVTGLTDEMLEHDPEVLERHRLTAGVWAALVRHRARHEERQNGFGYGIAKIGTPTRTLSARYYKDGAEILVPLPDAMLDSAKAPFRRLSHLECARLMGFVEPHLRRPFIIPERSRAQAYKQFGNAVVVPQVGWLARAIEMTARSEFSRRLAESYREAVPPPEPVSSQA
jgi:DNA (cytosine-5)-methyltransferase 1